MKLKNLMVALLALGASTTINGDILDTYSDTWVCCDGLGREVASADKGVTRNKLDSTVQIGMFYYIWHGQHGAEIKDITRLLEADPVNPAFGAEGQFHWGGKPVLGYYAGNDRFVISRHMQMLVDAGVDYYFFDVTNAFTYDENVKVVMAEIDRRTNLGLKAPKLAFMLHASTKNTATHIYNTFYKNEAYDKYWYRWNGKPLLLTNEDEVDQLSDEIKNFFTIRYSWAWSTGRDRWPWLANYPQVAGYTINEKGTRVSEQLSVSVAQHPSSKIGKSYHSGKQPAYDQYGLCKETPYGYYFQEQWNRALSMRPKMLMITQWNEWMAQRFLIKNESEVGLVRPGATGKVGETYFVDVYNQEFNRDIEPSSEPLIRDNYYLQMVSNARKYRGARQIPRPTACKTIKIDGEFSQWDSVTPEFLDEPGDCKYTSTTAQASASLKRTTNDFVKAKVTKDMDSLYFYVATSANIGYCSSTIPTRWMTLLLNVDCNYQTGWEGYDYMVSNDTGGMSLYHYNAETKAWDVMKNVPYQRLSKEMMFALSKKDVELTVDRDFDFKWIDNIPKASTEILDFIVDGDVAPNGRFNYRYKGSWLLSTGPSAVKTPLAKREGLTATSEQGKVRFRLPMNSKGKVSLRVCDLTGKELASLTRAFSSAGELNETIELPDGTYVARCSAAGVDHRIKFIHKRETTRL